MRFVATTHPIFNDNHNVTIIMYDHTHVHTHCGYPIVQYPNALQEKVKDTVTIHLENSLKLTPL